MAAYSCCGEYNEHAETCPWARSQKRIAELEARLQDARARLTEAESYLKGIVKYCEDGAPCVRDKCDIHEHHLAWEAMDKIREGQP